MKLGIGTAQFGMDYGITNKIGQTPSHIVEQIIKLAVQSGIQVLDTAPLYGNSEAVLGERIKSHPFKIVTKTSKALKKQISPQEIALFKKTFARSRKRLQLARLYGLLFHHSEDLLVEGGEALYDEAYQLKEKGLVEKIGVSVYSVREAENILNKYKIDLIQLPINILDQRFLTQGYLKDLKKAKIEIHARSAFLQGLLLMKPSDVPAYFSAIYPHLSQYHAYLANHELTPIAAALGFVMGIKEVDTVICGVNDHLQLQTLLISQKPLPCEIFNSFKLHDENYINPSKWKY